MAKKKKKKQKIRADFRKNRGSKARDHGLTRRFREDDESTEDERQGERVSGKGSISRKRTIVAAEITEDESGQRVQLAVDEANCLRGRVLSVHGLSSNVRIDDGRLFQCATRRLLKTLNTEQRHVVAAGDKVLIRAAGESEGIIERVEPRYGCLSRTSRGRQHVLVANVDQLLIIMSAAEPAIKPHLIDRMVVSAEKSKIKPVVCINKVDLVSPADLQPLVGVYGQMGYQVLLMSAESGFGVERLRQIVAGKQNAVAGQSGVGKSSLLNAIQPGLELRVRTVSLENDKGRHTTTAAKLVPLESGGYIVDTPGIRQFQLWDIIPEEVAGYFRDVRPYVSGCRYPNCTHTHEAECSVKDAVADNRLDARRYESFCQMRGEV
jgi:ribosome biogenesis GTPase